MNSWTGATFYRLVFRFSIKIVNIGQHVLTVFFLFGRILQGRSSPTPPKQLSRCVFAFKMLIYTETDGFMVTNDIFELKGYV